MKPTKEEVEKIDAFLLIKQKEIEMFCEKMHQEILDLNIPNFKFTNLIMKGSIQVITDYGERDYLFANYSIKSKEHQLFNI